MSTPEDIIYFTYKKFFLAYILPFVRLCLFLQCDLRLEKVGICPQYVILSSLIFFQMTLDLLGLSFFSGLFVFRGVVPKDVIQQDFSVASVFLIFSIGFLIGHVFHQTSFPVSGSEVYHSWHVLLGVGAR